MLSIICALAIQQQTVTFTHPCAHSSVVLEALGKEMGETIKPSGTVVHDYFLLRFVDLPKEAIYDKIAEVLNATWTVKDGVRYLGRTKEQEDAGIIAARKKLAEAIQRYIDEEARRSTTWTKDRAMNKVRPMLQQDGDLDRAAASSALGKDGPCIEFVDEFIRAVGAQRLAGLSFEDRVIFRWSPGKNDERMPVGLRSKAEAMVRNIETFGEGMRALGVPQLGDYDLPAEVRLGAARGLTADAFAFDVSVSTSGIYVSMISSGSNPIPYAATSIRVGPTELEAIPIDANGVFTPSDLSRAYCQRAIQAALGQTRRIDPESEPGKSLLEFFQKGTTPDPTHLGAGEPILALAESLEYNVIAVIQDWSAFIGYLVEESKDKPLANLASMLQERLGVQIDADNKWITVPAPSIYGKVGLFDATARVDRKALSTLVLNVYEKGWPTIDALAAYAMSCKAPQSWSIAHRVVSVLQPVGESWTWRSMTDGSLASLSTYGALPSSAKSSARKDWLTMPVRDLPAAVRERLHVAVDEKGFGGMRQDIHEMPWGGFPRGYISGDVVPSHSDVDAGFLEVRVENKQLLAIPGRSSGNRLYAPTFMTAEEAAMQLLYQRDKGINGVDYSNLGKVDAERLTLRLRLANGEEFEFSISTTSLNSETQFVRPESLTGELGEQLRQEIKKRGGN